MIAKETIQQIQQRIDIVEIVGSFVKLKKRGANYLGLCPFHNEKTPSFTVSPTKEIYKCFGCGRSGNTITFLMEHEKYSYVEALRWLAQKYDVEIEETEMSPEVREQQMMADSLYIVNNFARDFFADTLLNSEEGQDVGLSYLKERGYCEDTIQKFELGYDPDQRRNAFAEAALKKGYKMDYLQKTGLVVMRNNQPVDNYHGRVIFPVHNHTGKVIGFGARILKKNDRAPKYINTPENELYVKSKILYGTYFARHAIDKQDECLLVEGYTDVISLHQAGVENVVASGGTSLTPDQLRLIKKYSRNLTILYDGDAAGIKAAQRGVDLAVEEGLNVNLVLLPENEDPDSYVQSEGAAVFKNYIKENKKDFILFQLQLSLKEVGDDTNKKAALVNQIASTISRINKAEDFTRQHDYIRKSAELLKIEEEGLVTLVNKFIRERLQKKQNFPADEAKHYEEAAQKDEKTQDDAATLLQHDELQEKALLRVLLEHGDKVWDEHYSVAQYLLQSLDLEIIEDTAVRKALTTYKNLFEEGEFPDARYFIYHEDKAISTLAIAVMEFPYEVSHNWQDKFDLDVPDKEALYKSDVQSAFNYLGLRKIKKLLDENQREMEKATTYEEQLSCIEVHKYLKQQEKELTEKIGTVIYK